MDILGTIKGLVKTPGGDAAEGTDKMFSAATSGDLIKGQQSDPTGGIATSDEACKENITSSYDRMRSMLAKMRGK